LAASDIEGKSKPKYDGHSPVSDASLINPELARFYARRIGTTTTQIKASDVPFLSRIARPGCGKRITRFKPLSRLRLRETRVAGDPSEEYTIKAVAAPIPFAGSLRG